MTDDQAVLDVKDSRTADINDLPEDNLLRKQLTSTVVVHAANLPPLSFIRAVCETFPEEKAVSGLLFNIERIYDVAAGKATAEFLRKTMTKETVQKVTVALNDVAIKFYANGVIPHPVSCTIGLEKVPIENSDEHTMRIKALWKSHVIKLGG